MPSESLRPQIIDDIQDPSQPVVATDSGVTPDPNHIDWNLEPRQRPQGIEAALEGYAARARAERTPYTQGFSYVQNPDTFQRAYNEISDRRTQLERAERAAQEFNVVIPSPGKPGLKNIYPNEDLFSETGLSFEEALKKVKEGYRASRATWVFDKEFIFWGVPKITMKFSRGDMVTEKDATEILGGKYTDGAFALMSHNVITVGWLPDLGDISASDWRILK